jgi:hypothetical protein
MQRQPCLVVLCRPAWVAVLTGEPRPYYITYKKHYISQLAGCMYGTNS